MSDIQDYIEYIIKIHQTLKIIPPIHVYINRTNNRLVFKVKDGCRLESKMPDTMKSFGNTTKLTENKKRRKCTKS